MESICQYLGNNKCHRQSGMHWNENKKLGGSKSSAAATGSSESRVSLLASWSYVIPKVELVRPPHFATLYTY